MGILRTPRFLRTSSDLNSLGEIGRSILKLFVFAPTAPPKHSAHGGLGRAIRGVFRDERFNRIQTPTAEKCRGGKTDFCKNRQLVRAANFVFSRRLEKIERLAPSRSLRLPVLGMGNVLVQYTPVSRMWTPRRFDLLHSIHRRSLAILPAWRS
jgi:hypothetical protein